VEVSFSIKNFVFVKIIFFFIFINARSSRWFLVILVFLVFRFRLRSHKIAIYLPVGETAEVSAWPMECTKSPVKVHPIKIVHLKVELFYNKNTSTQSLSVEHGPQNERKPRFIYVCVNASMFNARSSKTIPVESKASLSRVAIPCWITPPK